jgi:hypothetical protein
LDKSDNPIATFKTAPNLSFLSVHEREHFRSCASNSRRRQNLIFSGKYALFCNRMLYFSRQIISATTMLLLKCLAVDRRALFCELPGPFCKASAEIVGRIEYEIRKYIG